MKKEGFHSNSFQKWMLTQGELDRLFYNCDLESIAKQTFATHVWSNENPDPAWIKVWLLDMQLVGKESIAVLMAGNNPHISQQLHYAIGFFSIANNAPPIQFKSVSVLNYNVHCVESISDANTSQSIPGCDYKLLLPESHGHQTAFVYNDSNVLCVPCKIYKLLCHSQHCEGCVKQTSKSLLTNANHDDQKSHIIVTEKSRERNPCTFTKESFKQSLNFDDNQK